MVPAALAVLIYSLVSPREPLASGTGEDLGVSGQAPDFQLPLFDGTTFVLSSLAGQSPVVVNFWFPSCPPCREEMPALEKVWRDYRDRGLLLVGVFSHSPLLPDTEEDARQFVREIGVTYPIGTDRNGEITQKYEVTGFPFTFFINKQGEIISKWAGGLTEARLRQMVEQLLQS